MTIKYDLPASIEGKRATLTTRKVILQLPIKNKYSRLKERILYQYKLDFNAEATIVEELIPKKHVINKGSMLDVGDGIKGDMIFCQTQAPFKSEVVKHSHTHSATHIDAKKFAYAKLEKPFKAIEDMNKAKKLL